MGTFTSGGGWGGYIQPEWEIRREPKEIPLLDFLYGTERANLYRLAKMKFIMRNATFTPCNKDIQ